MPEDRKFGEFLDGMLRPREVESSDPEDGLQKAGERYFLLKKLKVQLKARRLRGTTDGQCKLSHLVAAAKHHFPKKAKGKGSPLFLTSAVDKMLEAQGKELKDVCPKSWHNEKNLPRLFSDVLKHPTLKRTAATLISKAR